MNSGRGINKYLRLMILPLSAVVFTAIYANQAWALGGLNETAGRAGYEESDVVKIGGNVLNVILSFVGVLFLLVMMAGGFLWMTAGGKATQTDAAKKLLLTGIIGLIVVVSAYAISAWVGDSLN